MKINCDLGEGLDDIDTALMPLIDQANIACGAHAGNDATIARCIQLALSHKTEIGAHPSYPDRDNFGRVSLDISAEDLSASINTQCRNFIAICKNHNTLPSHIKPHGALYNDLASRSDIFENLLKIIASLNQQEAPLDMSLMVHAKLRTPNHMALAKRYSIRLIFEGFADRAYADDANLVSRKKTHAVFNKIEKITKQVEVFCKKGGVYSENGLWLPLKVDTLCIHGDNPLAVQALTKIIRSGVLL